jgi:hypothetical protein
VQQAVKISRIAMFQVLARPRWGGKDDVAVLGTSCRMAGGEHEPAVAQHPHLPGPNDRRATHDEGSSADGHAVAVSKLRQLQKRVPVGGPMGSDGERVLISVVEPRPSVDVHRQRQVEADPRDHDPLSRSRRWAGKRQPSDNDDEKRLTE